MEPTVFQQVLRAPFFNLPDTLRALHGIRGRGEYAGRTSIERGRNPLARLCAAVCGLPPTMRDVATQVEFIADDKREIWKRNFGGRRMTTKLAAHDGRLRERLGPMLFHFDLHTYEGAIYWNVARARLFGLLPLPARLFSGVQCREWEQSGRYVYRVEAALPLIGLLIRYEGWLEPAVGQREQPHHVAGG